MSHKRCGWTEGRLSLVSREPKAIATPSRAQQSDSPARASPRRRQSQRGRAPSHCRRNGTARCASAVRVLAAAGKGKAGKQGQSPRALPGVSYPAPGCGAGSGSGRLVRNGHGAASARTGEVSTTSSVIANSPTSQTRFIRVSETGTHHRSRIYRPVDTEGSGTRINTGHADRVHHGRHGHRGRSRRNRRFGKRVGLH